ncbi:MAG: SUF system Fe-S cluster assembly protein [Acidobacteriota bacterium]|nr:MAG: DUF59 domain-containing protein [Acidobacteriota bacterium]
MSDEANGTDRNEPQGAQDAQSGGELRRQVIEVLRTIYDPEIPVNIHDLGLIYEVDVDETSGSVAIKMTLTTPACPVATSLPPEVRRRVLEIPGVREADVEVVWDPPWSKDMISEEVKLQLGIL